MTARTAIGLGIGQGLVTWIALKWVGSLPGTDAYYWLVQAQSIAGNGHLKIHDGNVLAFVVAGLGWCGLSGVEATRVTFAAVHAAFATSLWVMVATGTRWRAVLMTGALLVAVTTLGLYHSVEFSKLTLAAAIVPWWSLSGVRSRRAIALATGAAIAAVTVHPAVLPLAGAWAVIAADRWISSGRVRIAAGVTVAFTGAAYMWMRFGRSGVIARVHEWSHDSAPGLWIFVHRTNLAPLLIVEASLLIAMLMVSAAMLVRRRKFAAGACCAAIAGLALLPSSTDQMFGLGERFVLLAAMAAPAMLLATWPADGIKPPTDRPRSRWPAALFIAVASSAFWEPSVIRNWIPRYDYRAFDGIVASAERLDATMLIAFRPLAFYYTSETGRDAFAFDPEPSWNAATIWRVVFDVPVEEFVPLASECGAKDLRPAAGAVAFLVREGCWESARRRITREEMPGLYARVWLNDRNPATARPSYLRERSTRSR